MNNCFYYRVWSLLVGYIIVMAFFAFRPEWTEVVE